MIERQRRGDVSLCRKNDQSDEIVGPLIDEALQNVSGHVETIDGFAMDLEIFGNHAARHIQRDDDIDAAGIDFGFAAGEPRLRQGKDENGECEPAEGLEKPAGARLRDIQNPTHQLHRGIDEGGWFAALAFEPGHEWQQKQQKKKIWMAEGHLSAGWGGALADSVVSDAGCPPLPGDGVTGSVSSTSRSAEPCRSRNSGSRGSYFANFTRSQRFRNSPRLSFWSRVRSSVLCNS